MSEAIAFEQAMAEMTAAEACGYDAIWLAETHFQKDRSRKPEAMTDLTFFCHRRTDWSGELMLTLYVLVCLERKDLWLGPCVGACPKGCAPILAPEIGRGGP